MRFIHLADLHLADNLKLDNEIGSIVRENTWKSFENILNSNKDADFALIAGDLFERNFFSSKDFRRLFEIIEAFGKDVYYVTGNHDYFDDFNTTFLNYKPDNLNIFTKDTLSLFEKDGLRVYGLSYKDRIYKRDFPYDLSLDHDFTNILLAHGDISQNPTNYLDLVPRKLKTLGFDYVALGHIHKAGNKENSYYPGSIEPLDFGHLGDYGYIVYDNGEVSHINSSLMKFYEFDIYGEDFSDSNELINYINKNLGQKVNFVRITINGDHDLNLRQVKNGISAKRLIVKENSSDNLKDIVNLYPNSLLSEFAKKFDEKNDDAHQRAYEIGVNAILRSKK